MLKALSVVKRVLHVVCCYHQNITWHLSQCKCTIKRKECALLSLSYRVYRVYSVYRVTLHFMWFAIEACCGQISVLSPYKDKKKFYLAFSIRKSLISSIQVKSLYVLIHLKALTNLGLGASSRVVKRHIICIRCILVIFDVVGIVSSDAVKFY